LPFVLRDTADEVPYVHLGADAFAPSETLVRAPTDGHVADVREHAVVVQSGDVAAADAWREQARTLAAERDLFGLDLTEVKLTSRGVTRR
jgi:hypothetical protein